MVAEPGFRRESFDEFYARYHPRLLGLAVGAWGAADAEDIAQEAMARAFAAYDRMDPDRDPWPWLSVIARNIARDLMRRRRVLSWIALESDEVLAMSEPDTPFEAASDVEERRLLRRALRRMPAADVDLLLARELGGATFGDLSRRTGKTENSLRQHALRARRRLAAEFTSLGGRALGVAVSVRARLRARTERLAQAACALPVAAQLAAAALAGTAALGGGAPVAATAFGTPAPVAVRPVVAAAVRHEAVPVVTAGHGGVAVRAAAPARAAVRRPHPPVRVRVTGSGHGLPGTSGGGHEHTVTVEVLGHEIGVGASGEGDGDPLICQVPVALCP